MSFKIHCPLIFHWRVSRRVNLMSTVITGVGILSILIGVTWRDYHVRVWDMDVKFKKFWNSKQLLYLYFYLLLTGISPLPMKALNANIFFHTITGPLGSPTCLVGLYLNTCKLQVSSIECQPVHIRNFRQLPCEDVDKSWEEIK